MACQSELKKKVSPFPRVFVTRKRDNPKSKCHGPFTDTRGLLGLSSVPRTIEGVDVSLLQGEDAVASFPGHDGAWPSPG